jgi:hypothetical protein
LFAMLGLFFRLRRRYVKIRITQFHNQKLG